MCLDKNNDFEINVLVAMKFARRAWYTVCGVAINNCFKKAGFWTSAETKILNQGKMLNLCLAMRNMPNLYLTKQALINLLLNIHSYYVQGAIACTLTQPMDVIKTRTMNAKPGEFK
ncbi:hypothetical protein PR048_002830, partial [Dryococelus australis]